MIDANRARAIAEQYVAGLSATSGIECKVISEPICEGKNCWVFGYQSVEALRTGSISAMLTGNAPIIVDGKTGEIFETGTARSTEYYLKNYEETGDADKELGANLELTGADPAYGKANGVRAIQSIRKYTECSLSEAKQAIDDCLEGKPSTIDLTDMKQSKMLAGELLAHGFQTRRLPEDI